MSYQNKALWTIGLLQILDENMVSVSECFLHTEKERNLIEGAERDIQTFSSLQPVGAIIPSMTFAFMPLSLLLSDMHG